jgi:hypothetical protein
MSPADPEAPPMLKRDDLPDDCDELAGVRVTLPRLKDDTEASCPVTRDQLLDLGLKDGDGAKSYVLVGLWRKAAGDPPSWAEGSRRREESLLSYSEAYGLKPEQFIAAEHFGID